MVKKSKSENSVEKQLDNKSDNQESIVENQTEKEPQIQIIYIKQRVHWFFRTLTIMALLAVWFFMLLETTWIMKLNIDNFPLNVAYSVFVIFSTIVIWSYRDFFGKIFGLILFLWVVWWVFTIGVYTSLNPSTESKVGSRINYEIPNWKHKEFSLNTMIWNFNIHSTDSKDIISGTWKSDRNLIPNIWSSGNVWFVNLSEDNHWNVLQSYYSNINLGFPSKIEFEQIYIKNLAWINTIDLTNIQWNGLKIHEWIDILNLKLWEINNESKIQIQSAFSDILLKIPEWIWVRLYFKHKVWIMKLENFEKKESHYYESLNITEVKNIVNINVKMWGGRFRINWY